MTQPFRPSEAKDSANGAKSSPRNQQKSSPSQGSFFIAPESGGCRSISSSCQPTTAQPIARPLKIRNFDVRPPPRHSLDWRTMASLVRLLCMLLLPVGVAAVATAQAEIPILAWETIASDPRFRVEMPSPVERENDTDPDGTRTTDYTHWFAEIDSFSLTITDYPDAIVGAPDTDVEIAADLEAVRDALAASFPGGRIVAEAALRRNGYRGLAFAIRYGGGRVYRSLLFVGPGESLVSLAVDVASEHQGDSSIERFFNSFSILRK